MSSMDDFYNGNKPLNDIDAFFKGYKASLLCNPYFYFRIGKADQLEKLKTYPFLRDPEKSGLVLYFQTDEAKTDFLERVQHLELGSAEFERALGIALGFPPKAVDFYVNCLQDPELEWKKIGMAYCGISCAGSIEDIMENVQWFWELEIPEDEYRDVSLYYSPTDPVVTYHVGYKCFEELRIAQEEILMISHRRNENKVR